MKERASREVIIPSELGGEKITGIETNAFSGHREIETVTIPDTSHRYPG